MVELINKKLQKYKKSLISQNEDVSLCYLAIIQALVEKYYT